jgi:hypothetical protein
VGVSGGYWLSQDTVMVRGPSGTKFVIVDLKTQQRADMPGISGDIENFFPSVDGKYLDYTTGGVEPKALRYRFADHQIETMTSLKGPCAPCAGPRRFTIFVSEQKQILRQAT